MNLQVCELKISHCTREARHGFGPDDQKLLNTGGSVGYVSQCTLKLLDT